MTKWTPAQEKAIYSEIGKNILVSAAAGSGKTAVLVERILNKLNKTSIENLLVVTFTRAAAAEMREKIISRIQKEIKRDDISTEELKWFKSQIRLCSTADITTIDAFCSKTVKNNFHCLGVDPNFKFADAAETELLEDTAMTNLFDRLYVERNERFSSLLEAYAYSSSDRKLRDLVKSVSHFTKTIAEPMEWLDAQREKYRDEDESVYRDICDIVWLVKEFEKEFSDIKSKRGIMDFADIEHLTYKLFKENEEVRKEYAKKYEEILIDEYQDTNGLQDAIFTSISRDNSNIFMVGDLKQSIYRFRGGDPYIFKNKAASYSDDMKIVLSQNFRSRNEILDGVNEIFENVMSDEFGDVVYEGDELLRGENPCYSERFEDYSCEAVNLVCSGEKTSSEALYIAERIKSMVDSKYKIFDKEAGIYRPVSYKDFTILMYSCSSSSGEYLEVFKNCGVKAYVETENYFDRREIRTMMSLIDVLNNCFQDIPFISVMRSPIGCFSDNELAVIRMASKGRSMYEAVKYFKGDENTAKKCAAFIENIERWRGYVRKKSVSRLIWSIYEESYFYDFMGVLEDGEEAQANLKLLYDRAKTYENSGFLGLFNFINYVKRIEKQSSDIGSAKIVGESHDVVRIMTIHKSKGLEFPIVFLAGTGKRFPGGQREKTVIKMHKNLGFGMVYTDRENGYYRDTVIKEEIIKQNKREELSEKMRLLYVALTRAKEKLIVVSSQPSPQREKCEKIMLPFSPDVSQKVSTFAGWIFPVAVHSEKLWKFEEIEMSPVDFEDKKEDEVNIKISDEVLNSIDKILGYKYGYLNCAELPSKTSVTALKQRETGDMDMEEDRMADEDYLKHPLKPLPEFMTETVSAAELGTAYHTVMSLINLDKIAVSEDIYKIVSDEIERLKALGAIQKKLADKIEADKIALFFKSEIGKRMLKAKRIYREKAFQIPISVSEYDSNIKNSEGETILLQGVIDCFFEENDGNVVLIDFKTDKCDGSDEKILELKEKYRSQLDYYERAIAALTGKIVKKDKYLYLFSVGCVV